MRRAPLLFPLCLAVLAACGTDPESLNKDFSRTNKYAEARFLALVPNPQTFSAFVATGEELPVVYSFADTVGLPTAFKQQVIGEWNGYVTKQTATTAEAKATTGEGERWTAVLVSGANNALALSWHKETSVTGSQPKVRFVAGYSGLSDATVKVGSTTLTGPFEAGQMSAWQDIAAGAVTVDVTPAGGTTSTFAGVTIASGELWSRMA
jgi:hypothetical protein